MSKFIKIKEYNLTYTEGPKPVYLQIYFVNDEKIELGFAVCDSDVEALFLGATKGKVISNVRLLDIFKKLKKFASEEEKIKLESETPKE